MGQRSQTFIISSSTPIKNIIKNRKLNDLDLWRDRMDEFVTLKQEEQEFYNLFGNTEIIKQGFHNNWLYGRSLVLTAIRILEFNKYANMNKNSNPFHPEFSYNFKISSIKNWIGFVSNLLSIMSDPLSQYARAGIEKFTNLSYNNETWVQHSVMKGDNNDGILILDLTRNKYCFMNIGEADSTVMQLPERVPCSGKQYLEAYYPTEATNRFKDQHQGEAEEKMIKILKFNIKINKLFTKRLDKFSVLTMDELAELYPQDFQVQLANN